MNSNLKSEFSFDEEKHTIEIIREFDAKLEMVWEVWTKPEHLANWWGPPGLPITVEKYEFAPQGIFLYSASVQGQSSFGKFVYHRIIKQELLEYITSFSDENGQTIRAPFNEKFPLEIFNSVIFSEQNERTTIVLRGTPLNATEEELEFFSKMSGSIQQGFAGSCTQLENYLETLKKH
ncbi:MAG: SRPBCC domain-containing protein [Bacteroidetes bacterium]|nr:SRPBCC domain-containing protein [Bacteroidota bacterium]